MGAATETGLNDHISQDSLLLLHQYFQRIGFELGPESACNSSNPALPAPTRQNLVLLHRCHCLTIPWENLSVVHPLWKTEKAFVNPDLVTAHRKLVLQQQGKPGAVMGHSRRWII